MNPLGGKSFQPIYSRMTQKVSVAPLFSSATTNPPQQPLREGEVIGHVPNRIIDKRTKTPVNVVISKTPGVKTGLGNDFIVYLPKPDGTYRELGHLSIHETLGQRGPALHIDTIDTRKGNLDYKGLGVLLQQVAVEVALKEGLSEIDLTTCNIGGGDPVGFHFKGGWRTGSMAQDHYLERAIEAGTPCSIGNMVHMELSPEAWEKWKETIQHAPVLPTYDPLSGLKASHPKEWLRKVFTLVVERGVQLPADIIQEAKALAARLSLKRYNPKDLD